MHLAIGRADALRRRSEALQRHRLVEARGRQEGQRGQRGLPGLHRIVEPQRQPVAAAGLGFALGGLVGPALQRGGLGRAGQHQPALHEAGAHRLQIGLQRQRALRIAHQRDLHLGRLGRPAALDARQRIAPRRDAEDLGQAIAQRRDLPGQQPGGVGAGGRRRSAAQLLPGPRRHQRDDQEQQRAQQQQRHHPAGADAGRRGRGDIRIGRFSGRHGPSLSVGWRRTAPPRPDG